MCWVAPCDWIPSQRTSTLEGPCLQSSVRPGGAVGSAGQPTRMAFAPAPAEEPGRPGKLVMELDEPEEAPASSSFIAFELHRSAGAASALGGVDMQQVCLHPSAAAPLMCWSCQAPAACGPDQPCMGAGVQVAKFASAAADFTNPGSSPQKMLPLIKGIQLPRRQLTGWPVLLLWICATAGVYPGASQLQAPCPGQSEESRGASADQWPDSSLGAGSWWNSLCSGWCPDQPRRQGRGCAAGDAWRGEHRLFWQSCAPGASQGSAAQSPGLWSAADWASVTQLPDDTHGNDCGHHLSAGCACISATWPCRCVRMFQLTCVKHVCRRSCGVRWWQHWAGALTAGCRKTWRWALSQTGSSRPAAAPRCPRCGPRSLRWAALSACRSSRGCRTLNCGSMSDRLVPSEHLHLCGGTGSCTPGMQ